MKWRKEGSAGRVEASQLQENKQNKLKKPKTCNCECGDKQKKSEKWQDKDVEKNAINQAKSRQEVFGIEKEVLNSELGSTKRLQGQQEIIGKTKRHLKFSSSSSLSQLLHPVEGTELA